MAEPLAVMDRQLRAAPFMRARYLQEVLAARGWTFTDAEFLEAVHRYKGRQSMRGRLRPSEVKAAAERLEKWTERYEKHTHTIERVRTIERRERPVINVTEVYEEIYNIFTDAGGGGVSTVFDWDSFERSRAVRYPQDLLDDIIAALADLVAGFLEQLEEVGRFELPPVATRPLVIEYRAIGDPGADVGAPGELGAGFEMQDVGASTVLTAQVPAASVRTVVSEPVEGPVVVERVGLWSDAAFDGDVQLNAVWVGASYPSAAAPESIGGEALLFAASNFGASGSRVEWLPFGRNAEFWPRRLVRFSGARFVLTVGNDSAAERNFVAGIDRRAVRRTG